MDLATYRERFSAEDAAPGWDAITHALTDIYDEQEPQHWGPALSHALGGSDPLDGISAYSKGQGGVGHLHFASYGYSSLYYDEDAVGQDHSGFGFEMTLRLATPLPPTEEPVWVCNLLQNLARYVFKTGKHFANGHWIPTNGPIRADFDTEIVGLAFVTDTELQPIQTVHGRVEFIQAFGLTQCEVDALKKQSRTCQEIVDTHRLSNPLLVTDLRRTDAS